MKWFERKFDFSCLNGTMANIIERLSDTPLRLRNKLSDIQDEKLATRVGESWSIQEHVGHLLDLEPLWYGRIKDMIEGAETMRPADLENRKTHEADHNSRSLGEILDDFEKERNKLVSEMVRLKDRAEELSAKHPRLEKPMRLIDLAFFVAEHDDHHLASITELNK